jgi:hypothetical protein
MEVLASVPADTLRLPEFATADRESRPLLQAERSLVSAAFIGAFKTTPWCWRDVWYSRAALPRMHTARFALASHTSITGWLT